MIPKVENAIYAAGENGKGVIADGRVEHALVDLVYGILNGEAVKGTVIEGTKAGVTTQ